MRIFQTTKLRGDNVTSSRSLSLQARQGSSARREISSNGKATAERRRQDAAHDRFLWRAVLDARCRTGSAGHEDVRGIDAGCGHESRVDEGNGKNHEGLS